MKNNLVFLFRIIIDWIFKNKFIVIVLAIYSILMLSIIDWGIPNPSHPFAYQMDEWHQLQAIRSTIKFLTPNLPGAAHGTMFHFILSGLYLVPFYFLRIIDPFAIKSSVELLESQQKLFEILRLNTLIFGLLSIFYIAKIAKDYLKINKNIVVILFVVSPLWLALSNYFKYDIALIFWIVISLYYLLKFGSKPNLRNYLISGIFCSLALATKISALPILLAYLISYFWFKSRNKWMISELCIGIVVFLIVFILLGIPDILLGKGDWREFLYSNLVIAPNTYGNMITGFNSWWKYLIIKILPIDFGYCFFMIYVGSAIYWLISLLKSLLKKKFLIFKAEYFLLLCFLFFILSLVPLKIGANGNRLLVLLPFFALLSGAFLHRILKSLNRYKFVIWLIFASIFIVQFYQSIIIVYVKWLPDARQTSSEWIKKNIAKNTLIGIENIPIYQMLPDIIIKEFYSKERNSNYPTSFKYQIVDASSKTLPSVVVIPDKELELHFFKESPKKLLIERMIREKYKEVIEFKSPEILHLFTENDLNFFVSGLALMFPISIYEK